MTFILLLLHSCIVAELFKILVYTRCQNADTKSCTVTKYGISVQTKSIGLRFCKGYVLLELHNFCGGGYDVPIATYLLPDLYLIKMKNALFSRLSCACAV